MRRSLVALHIVSLSLWLGGLVFSFLLAATLFSSLKPFCPGCVKPLENEARVSCATCGALHHQTCAGPGCGLEHEGSHTLGLPPQVSAISSTGLARWERVKLKSETVAPERRLLWRLDATSAALQAEKGEVAGACFELSRAGVGDSLARSFALVQVVSVGMAIATLLTVLLTPPGGALRFLRVVALGGALGLAVYGLSLGHGVATQRLSLESTVAATPEIRAAFGKTHGIASAVNVAETLLVLVGLVLALERRPEPPKP